MATPLTATQLKNALTKWGVPFKEVKSWETHGRDSATGKPFGPVHGFVWHHTGADTKDAAGYVAGTLYGGLSTLPGPLCHIGLAPDGTAYLVSIHRANHAGGGDPVVLQHVINEDYSGILRPTKGNSNGVDGNDPFYGMEIMYSGSHGMTASQYTNALKISCAILDAHGWTHKSVIAHGEWSSDKWDPGYAPGKMMDMNAVRNDIADMLKRGPGGKETPVVDKPDSKSDVYKQVWETDAATPPKGHETTENPTWWPMSLLKYACEKLDEISAQLDALEKKVG